MASTQSQVSRLLDSQAEAMRAKDLDRLMSLYSPEVVYFDAVPPLRYAGSAALRERFTRWFAGFAGPVEVDTRERSIVASGDLAVAHWFSRVRGTLTSGREVGSWVRVTSCCRRAPAGWLISHEHVSFPVDMASGRAATDLVPE